MSAAHCFKNLTLIPELFVVLGIDEPLKAGIKIDVRRNTETIYEIEEVMIQEKYQIKKKEAYYDVSLTRLKKKVDISEHAKYIYPICLPLKVRKFQEKIWCL